MPLAGILVQYTGWSSVFYVYGEYIYCISKWNLKNQMSWRNALVNEPPRHLSRILWHILVHVLDLGVLREPGRAPNHQPGGASLHRGEHRWERPADGRSGSEFSVWAPWLLNVARRRASSWFCLFFCRNSRPPGGSFSLPCLSMQSSWPISAGAGPFICSSSASQLTLKRCLALKSAR